MEKEDLQMELSDQESEERDDVTDVSEKCEDCA